MRALALLAVIGCMGAAEPAPPTSPSCTLHDYFAENLNNKVDLLFVIDDSAAMSAYVPALDANTPVFMNIMRSLPTPPNMHIAVAHASNGAVVDPVPCGAQAGSSFLIDTNGGAVRNYNGTLQDVFSCLAHVGSDSGGTQQPLAAGMTALTMTTGFLRDVAYLSVIFITPQDDTSPADPPIYVGEFGALKSAPNHVLVSAITNYSATRLRGFVDAFGNLSTFTSIDQTSWADAFSVFARQPGGGPSYLYGCVFAKLVSPGICTFNRVQNVGTPMQQQLGTMPPCNPSGQSSGICGGLVVDPGCPISGMRYAICYNGFDPTNPSRPCPYGDNTPEDAETVVVECAVECN